MCAYYYYAWWIGLLFTLFSLLIDALSIALQYSLFILNNRKKFASKTSFSIISILNLPSKKSCFLGKTSICLLMYRYSILINQFENNDKFKCKICKEKTLQSSLIWVKSCILDVMIEWMIVGSKYSRLILDTRLSTFIPFLTRDHRVFVPSSCYWKAELRREWHETMLVFLLSA